MELPTWASFLGVVLATVMLLKAIQGRRSGSRRAYKLPPGPKPWPIIGNLNLISALPHRSIHELAKKYGPLMQLQFGSFPVVVASSVDMAKFFLKTQDAVFADRPKVAAGKYISQNYRDITFAPYGAYWRQARKMCMTELFSAKRLDQFEYIRVAEVRALVRELHDAAASSSGSGSGSGAAVVMLKDHLASASLNVITRMVLGKKYLGNKEAAVRAGTTPEEFKWMLDELFFLGGVLNVTDSIPWLEPVDPQGYIRRMKKIHRMFDRFLQHVVDDHEERRRREGKDWVVKDMIDALLHCIDDPTLEVEFNHESVKLFCLDIVAGGTESSAVTVEWAISELLRNPEVLARATEELDRVIGRDRWVDESDMPSLPYVEAVIKETFRLHMVSPLLVPRMAREDSTVDGYDIPAGTRVLINIWTPSRDPKQWDAPEEFRPERFLGGSRSKIDVKGTDFELLPFGAGRRMCPGYNLGLKVIQLSLANLLHGFSWGLPEGVKKEDLTMEEVWGLSTPRKDPLKAVVKPRLPARLYAEPTNDLDD